MNATPMLESSLDPIRASLDLAIMGKPKQIEEFWLASQKLREMVLQAVASKHSKRNYAKALDEVFTLCANRAQPISRALLLDYRSSMIEKGLSPSTINVRLAAIRT